MADEIERCLVTNLLEASNRVEAAAKHGSAKSASKHLKERLQLQPSNKLTRDQLYSLNNLLAEWEMRSNTTTRIPFKSTISDWKFSSNVKGELQERPAPAPAPAPAGISKDPQGQNDGNTPPQPSNHQESPAGEIEPFRRSTRSVDPKKVYGLDDKAMTLQRLLVNEPTRFQAVGIVGMRGIGKTTLCQVIFNKQEVKDHFLPRIWVCMSKQPQDDGDNKKVMVKRMLTCLGVEAEIINSPSDSLKKLLFALRLQLMGKRYLIVLDDVWSADVQDFCTSLADQDGKCSEKLAYGLPKGYGGAVIVTSRSEELGKKMVGEENLRRLMPLSDQVSCWEIFKDSYKEDGKQFPEVWEHLKGKILDKCAGLPLAAKMMGQIAREQPQKTN